MSIYQPSLTEWLEGVEKQIDIIRFREEDSSRTERLFFLNKVFSFPAELPIIFKATELMPPSESFKQFLNEKGKRLGAIRLVPIVSGLPKLRERGMSLEDCYNKWFLKQSVPLNKYHAEVFEHIDKTWSTAFIVNEYGIFGEIIAGGLTQLTTGDTENYLYQFGYDYKNWIWSKEDFTAQEALNEIIDCVKVENKEKKTLINKKIGSNFYHNFLEGYYEAYIGINGKILFIDYGLLLARYLKNVRIVKKIEKENKNFISGAVVYPGKVRGRVKLVDFEKNVQDFEEGDILVCDNTDVRYIPFMKKSLAIVTDRGGILSHAAIVARELKKPCVIGTKIATNLFKDGDIIEVDANNGTIKKMFLDLRV